MLKSWTNKNFLAGLALLLLCLAAYGNSLANGFLMDDRGLILNNQHRFDPQFLQIEKLVTPDSAQAPKTRAYFRPLYHFMIAANYALFERNAVGYHAVNLALHYLASVTLFIFLVMLFKHEGLALFSSALYALHPVNGLLVNYSNTTGISVMVLAMILGLIFFLKMNAAQRFDGVYLILSLGCFAAALLCHEVAVVYPLYWVVCLCCMERIIPKKAFIYGVLLGVIVVIYGLLRMQVVTAPNLFLLGFEFFDFNVLNYGASLAQLLAWYFSKLIYPVGIVLMWEGKILTAAPQIIVWIGVMAFCLFVFLWGLRHCGKRNPFILSLGWMAVGVLPVALASLSRPNYGFIIEPHWLIFVSIGFFVGLSQLFIEIRNKVPAFLWKASLACLLISYMLVGWRYNYLWGKEERYLTYWLGESPQGYLPNFWMGSLFLEKGELQSAKVHYEKILQRPYTDWETYVNLGVIEHYAGNSEAALRYYQKALELNSQCADALNNIGVIFRDQGEQGKAGYYFNKALEIDSRHVDARKNLSEIQ